MPDDPLSSSASPGGLICELAGWGRELPSTFRLSRGLNGRHTAGLAAYSQPVGEGTASSWGFPGGADGKASACSAGEWGSVPELGRSPGEGTGNPLQVFLPGESHGRRSLAGYRPWGRKELNSTEQLNNNNSRSAMLFSDVQQRDSVTGASALIWVLFPCRPLQGIG